MLINPQNVSVTAVKLVTQGDLEKAVVSPGSGSIVFIGISSRGDSPRFLIGLNANSAGEIPAIFDKGRSRAGVLI